MARCSPCSGAANLDIFIEEMPPHRRVIQRFPEAKGQFTLDYSKGRLITMLDRTVEIIDATPAGVTFTVRHTPAAVTFTAQSPASLFQPWHLSSAAGLIAAIREQMLGSGPCLDDAAHFTEGGQRLRPIRLGGVTLKSRLSCAHVRCHR